MLTLERVHGTALAPAIYEDDRQFGGAYHFDLLATEALIPAWVDAMGRYIASLGAPVIGATTTFQQTAPAVALLRAARRYTTDAITIIGGANCEGEMAEGIRSLAPFIDYVFSGESEETFPRFVGAVTRGERPSEPIIQGRPCEDMDAVPTVEFDDYFEQRAGVFTPEDSAAVGPSSIVYETSRGCWWGEKQHCTFCGLNGEGMGFRTKSAERVVAEIRTLAGKYHPQTIIMADNIMPYEYFSTVLPTLAKELPGLEIFYEQKANLSRERLVLLKDAGIHSIQPGIEALSTDLLRLMRKGTTARQNIGLLRDAGGVQISLAWNLLWGFPGDQCAAYEETLAMLPLIHHLEPPSGLSPLGFDRFSPYFNQADRFGIRNLRPYPGYYDFLPRGAPIEKVAYHFIGDYPCAGVDRPELMREIYKAVQNWRSAWATGQHPELRVYVQGGGYWLLDTRAIRDAPPNQPLSSAEARRLVVSDAYDDSPDQRSLIRDKLALKLDGYFVPLAVVDQSVYLRLCGPAPANATHQRTRAGGVPLVLRATA
jgi:ribosomal peptide maturation radical SAM protein 1